MDRLARDTASLFHTYKRLPLEIERGAGMYLYARDGTRYLDLFSGLAVNALGYGHPGVLQAITNQAARYTHLSNYYAQEPQLQLAELLVKHGHYGRVFFANSGTETIEGAIKLARRWGSSRGKTDLVSFSNAFHGRTLGALSLMDRPKYRDGFGPFLENCRLAEFNNPDALRATVNEHTAAVVLEFIQGEGGVRPIAAASVDLLRELQKAFGFLVVADEIQSGIGRTGKFFGFQHYTIVPDIVVVAKPIGGGLPLGAILANDSVAAVLEPGMHGTTFGGNPVACAAGAVVVREVAERGLMQNAEKMGGLFKERLHQLHARFPRIVKEVRGFGLMLGVELTTEGETVVAAMRERGILINCTDQTVLRFLPPLIVTAEQIEEASAHLLDILSGQ
jgi:acetylornithine/N-succinyldiaminopimelate aminotransferase